MRSRRSLLAAGATGALALSAGCLGVVLGNEPLEFHASRVAPTEEVLSETGYEEHESTNETYREEVDVGVTREISASYWRSIYTKAVEIQGTAQEAATFAAVSVPGMDVLGTDYNPLSELDNEELLDQLREQIDGTYDGLRDVRHDETIELEILGETRDVDRFLATTDLEGQEIEVAVLLAAFDHDGDLLVLLGGHPEMLPDEGVDLEVLMESIEHPLE
ncbi:DUF6517 family protein [Natribaculum luteum]|uniref:DUF6517 family protein n=1 Tax=Natribaculum luteum TaxID=1586232 RepID=A0ABD5P560_9EURY|nr:DUF6517 family protein [Natribaculum luteum]